jgi:hypothetical protein
MGTRQETRPTPRPAKTRPTANFGIVVEATWIATPMENTKVERIIPRFLPSKSAAGAASRAPGRRKIRTKGERGKCETDQRRCLRRGWRRLEILVRR